jgi:HSP20 family protein
MFQPVFSSFPGGLFGELDRLQRSLNHPFNAFGTPSIRAVPQPFPAINIGNTPGAVEIYAFVPGVEPSKLDVSVDRGLLTLSGERASAVPDGVDRVNRYAEERFAGRFKRVISLPEDADPAKVEARYRDGVLRVTVGRRESAQPRRIEVK